MEVPSMNIVDVSGVEPEYSLYCKGDSHHTLFQYVKVGSAALPSSRSQGERSTAELYLVMSGSLRARSDHYTKLCSLLIIPLLTNPLVLLHQVLEHLHFLFICFQ